MLHLDNFVRPTRIYFRRTHIARMRHDRLLRLMSTTPSGDVTLTSPTTAQSRRNMKLCLPLVHVKVYWTNTPLLLSIDVIGIGSHPISLCKCFFLFTWHIII
jgi:hypothetical protein